MITDNLMIAAYNLTVAGVSVAIFEMQKDKKYRGLVFRPAVQIETTDFPTEDGVLQCLLVSVQSINSDVTLNDFVKVNNPSQPLMI